MQARFLRVLEAAVIAANSVATEITQIFRPERYSRSDTNVRPLQAINSATWVGLGDMPPAARETFDTDHTFAAGDTGTFIRFRKRFETDGST